MMADGLIVEIIATNQFNMIEVKESASGVDIWVKKMNTLLYNSLCNKWNIPNDQYNCYGRIYRVEKSNLWYPQTFIGALDYEEVFYNDSVAASSFWHYNGSSVKKGIYTADMALFFCVNLSMIKEVGLQRADEDVRCDVAAIVDRRYQFTMTGIEVGIDKIFREFNGWKRSSGRREQDMQPSHCFRINTQLFYNPQSNDC